MEDSSEAHSDENKVSADMGKKRILKTPGQLKALEDFFNDHKFPTEEMKLQLAQQLMLTEKQISSWFCHRRLKDKRRTEGYANGRQDYSSGVIQDHNSGLKQDSCGSIKQGEYSNIEPREVESQRNGANDIPFIDQRSGDLRHKPKAYVNHSDDPSSESSSGLQNQVLSESVDPYNTVSSAHLKPTGTAGAIPTRDKKVGYKPMGYLKVKGEVENPAITTVKRQLGMQYREDGPPLSVEFDLPPPGAFDYADNDPVDDALAEPIHVKHPRQSHSPEVYPHPKEPFVDPRYQVPRSRADRWDSDDEEAAYNYDNWPGRNSRVVKQRPPFFDGSNLCPAWDSSLNAYENSGKVSRFQSNINRMSSKHDMEGLSDPFPNYDRSYGKKVSKEQVRPSLPDGLNGSSKISRRAGIQLSNTTSGYRDDELDPEERVPSSIMEKAGKQHGYYKPKRVYRDPSRSKLPVNEMKVHKGFKDEFLQPEYVGKASLMRSLPNQVKGSSMDVLSSFSEDEDAENSPSFDGAT